MGGADAAVLAQSDTSITVIAPPGESVDTAAVRVTSIGGTASAAYAYTAPDLCGTGCVFTSRATVSVATRVPFTFTVRARGYVTPTFRLTGTLPAGVSFVDNYNGTATLSGTTHAVGTHREKVVATFAYGTAVKRITQFLVLTVR